MIFERIGHYPAIIQEPVKRWVAQPLRSSFAFGNKGRRLNDIGSSVTLKSPEIQKDSAFWVTAMLAPCIFVAAVSREAGGEIDEAVVGHFSTRFAYRSISSLLGNLKSGADTSSIFIAGLAEKASHESLAGTCIELVDEAGEFGIPLRLEWSAEDRPILRDNRSGKIISDIGIGLNNDNRDFSYIRNVGFGVTTTHAVMLSTVFQHGTNIVPKWTHLLGEDVGLLTHTH